MNKMIEISDTIHSTLNENLQFKKDVLEGLSQKNKKLSSKYFYDDEGAKIFNKIMHLNDYYLAKCEMEILTRYQENIADRMDKTNFNLVELGPGNGAKSAILLNAFLKNNLIFRYTPIDISKKYLEQSIISCQKKFSKVKVTPIHADFLSGLEWQSDHSERCNFVLFLGSSIGNFNFDESKLFLRKLWKILHHGDFLLLGFDLKKDIPKLLKAYDDKEGVTKEFNLNLLNRINKNLGANFNLNQFNHYATYNPVNGAMESYLISLLEQEVSISALGKVYHFDAFEPIHTEYSFKYEMNEIYYLAKETGFHVVENFLDEKKFFLNSLWKVIKKQKKD